MWLSSVSHVGSNRARAVVTRGTSRDQVPLALYLVSSASHVRSTIPSRRCTSLLFSQQGSQGCQDTAPTQGFQRGCTVEPLVESQQVVCQENGTSARLA